MLQGLYSFIPSNKNLRVKAILLSSLTLDTQLKERYIDFSDQNGEESVILDS